MLTIVEVSNKTEMFILSCSYSNDASKQLGKWNQLRNSIDTFNKTLGKIHDCKVNVSDRIVNFSWKKKKPTLYI